MTTSLTTFDGYPRADIDVAQIRTTRARIIRLKNDHKEVMAQLEKAVHEQFAAGKAMEAARSSAAGVNGTTAGGGSARTDTMGPGNATGRTAAVVQPPFAKVNTVTPDSPAEQAGLRAGDKVVRFGEVDWTNHERLGRVAREVQQNENVSCSGEGDVVSLWVCADVGFLAEDDSCQGLEEYERERCLADARFATGPAPELGWKGVVGLSPASVVIAPS